MMLPRLATTFCGLIAGPAILFADAAVAQAESLDSTSEVIEEIVVTGSRIKRRDATSPSPISTLGRDGLTSTGGTCSCNPSPPFTTMPASCGCVAMTRR